MATALSPLSRFRRRFPEGAFDPTMDKQWDESIPSYEQSLVSSPSLSPSPVQLGPRAAIAPTLGQHTDSVDSSPELAAISSKLMSAINAPQPGMLRQVIGAMMSRRNPALGGLVSGQTQRQRAIQPLQLQYEMAAEQQKRELNQRNIESEIGYRGAHGDYLKRIAEMKEEPKPEVPHTIQAGDKTMQWNPDTHRFDIEVGPAKPSGGNINTAEDLKNRIAQAYEAKDFAKVKSLQDELKALDPGGMERLDMMERRLQMALNKANKSGSKIPMVTQSRLTNIMAIRDQIDHIKGLLDDPDVKALTGPVVGLVGGITSQFNPKIAGLKQALTTLAALQPIVHGYRGGQRTHQIFMDASSLRFQPDALKAALDEARGMSERLQNTIKTQYPGDPVWDEFDVGGGQTLEGKTAVPAVKPKPTGGSAKQVVKIGGRDVAVSADGTFSYNGHTYKINADGKGGTLVK